MSASDADVLRESMFAQAEMIHALRARVAELEKDAARWKLLTRVASLGFDDAPLWKAVIRLPVFDNGDQTITALVDRIAIAERAADK